MEIKFTKTTLQKALLLTTVYFFILVKQGYGQEQKQNHDEEPENMSSGRPDLTIGTSTIPPMLLQIEAGLSLEKGTEENQEIRLYQYPQVLLRLGVLDWLELRLQGAVQDSVIENESGSRRQVSGIGPVEVGTRIHLWNQHGLLPETAIQVEFILPIGRSDLQPNSPESHFIMALAYELSPRLGLTYNVGYGWSQGDPLKSYGVNLTASVSNRVMLYVEALGEKQEGEEAAHQADAGLLYLLIPNLQLDFAAGTQLNSAAPDYFLTTGITWRLPR